MSEQGSSSFGWIIPIIIGIAIGVFGGCGVQKFLKKGGDNDAKKTERVQPDRASSNDTKPNESKGQPCQASQPTQGTAQDPRKGDWEPPIDDRTIAAACGELTKIIEKPVVRYKTKVVEKIVYRDRPIPIETIREVSKPWKWGCNVDWTKEQVAAVADRKSHIACRVDWQNRKVRTIVLTNDEADARESEVVETMGLR